jgi:hypothetical protein
MSAYANAKFLIYSKFETVPELTKSTIAGSLLIDSALTEEEAKEKLRVYQERSACAISPHSYVYIANQPEWWTSK